MAKRGLFMKLIGVVERIAPPAISKPIKVISQVAKVKQDLSKNNQSSFRLSDYPDLQEFLDYNKDGVFDLKDLKAIGLKNSLQIVAIITLLAILVIALMYAYNQLILQ